MTDEIKQPVVDDTNASAKPEAAVDSARNDGDLDTLLAQFEQQTKVETPVSPPAQQQTTQPPAIDSSRVARIENRLFQEDLNKTVTNIMGDMKVPRRLATGWLDQMARENPRIAQAFANKDSNPDAWSRIEKTLAVEFAKEMKGFTSVDQNVTEDVALVAAAVRGASTNKAPESPPPNFGKMSNNDFRNEVRQKYGYDPGV